MSSALPIGIDTLLHGAVESSRLELKRTWDSATTGPQVLKTITAFANDMQNLNGGYVVVGVEDHGGVARRPVVGLTPDQLHAAQQWIRGNCNRIVPAYFPIFFVENIDDRQVLVCWVPASENRPHQAPDGLKGPLCYWVRIGADTVAAKESILNTLIQQTARIPFDDRRATDATPQDLSITLVREFLHSVQSGLTEVADEQVVYQSMQILRPQNGHHVPRNVALLFFNDAPHLRFPGARIEIVEFPDDGSGDVLREQHILGPLSHQVRQALLALQSHIRSLSVKSDIHPQASVSYSYALVALREAVVNATYHRGYENTESSSQPMKIYVYPNRIEIISYPGPVSGIDREHFLPDAVLPPIPARNRRIGEFLKELRLAEGRGTGLLKIRRSTRDNGSPDPIFDFDDDRSYFRVTFPIHPQHLVHLPLPVRDSPRKMPKVFLSYASKDRAVVEDLMEHLVPLQRNGGLVVWSDLDLVPGESWSESISKESDQCDIFVPVVTKSYLASEFVWKHELPHFVRRAVEGSVIIAPLYAGPAPVRLVPVRIVDSQGRERQISLDQFEGFSKVGNKPSLTLEEVRANDPVAYERMLADVVSALLDLR